MKNLFILLLLSVYVFIVSCYSGETLSMKEYENHKRIIYGKIPQRLFYDEEELNKFLIKNESVKINCSVCLFRAERISMRGKRNVLKLQQYYKGYKVFGHTVVLHTNEENIPVYIIDHSFPLSGFEVPLNIISQDEAKRLLLEYLNESKEGYVKFKPIELGIVTYTEKPVLRYRVKVSIPKRVFDGGTFDIDAVTKEIVRYEPALISTTATVINTNGDSVGVEISKNPDEYSDADCANSYCAVDTTRGKMALFDAQYIKTFYEIEPATYPGELPPSYMMFSSFEQDIWDGAMPDGMQTRRIEGISAHYSVQRIYDWYSSLGLRGNVNKDNGVRVFLEKMSYDPLGLNAFWDINSHSAMVIWVYQPDKNISRSFASSYDVIGHEFTHSVLSAPLSEGGLAELEYNNSNYPKNESASVQEGFADTMGSLSQGEQNPNWLMGYNGLIDENGNHRWLRNDSDPYDPEALTWGDKEYIGQCTQRLCSKYPPPSGHNNDCQMPFDMYDSTYICATTIAYPAWKIKNAIGVEKTSKIYFNVIDKYLQKKELIPSVSQYVFDSCLELYDNANNECCEVYKALSESKFDIDLRGIVCSSLEDAGPDIYADTMLIDADESDSEYKDIFDTNADDIFDVTIEDIPEIMSEDIDVQDDEYLDELNIIDSEIEDNGGSEIKDVGYSDILLEDTLVEDTKGINDILKEDIDHSKSEDSSEGCSCAFIE